MEKKTHFWTDLGQLFQAIILHLLKENQWTKFENMAKNLISGLILACLAQSWAKNIFSWVLAVLDVRHCS